MAMMMIENCGGTWIKRKLLWSSLIDAAYIHAWQSKLLALSLSACLCDPLPNKNCEFSNSFFFRWIYSYLMHLSFSFDLVGPFALARCRRSRISYILWNSISILAARHITITCLCSMRPTRLNQFIFSLHFVLFFFLYFVRCCLFRCTNAKKSHQFTSLLLIIGQNEITNDTHTQKHTNITIVVRNYCQSW